ncbi:hypothetical protein BpHYR1_048801 [Brachionus plicatilis]|uniref:Uncharacterized protein n=1 Tax=Brachionus plicatilis TaxID=10195 RepID=A0A3M7RJ81_BRAPC|nr:hypothetical protein BpHYR1_048801 [Brachionus plicatilis]
MSISNCKPLKFKTIQKRSWNRHAMKIQRSIKNLNIYIHLHGMCGGSLNDCENLTENDRNLVTPSKNFVPDVIFNTPDENLIIKKSHSLKTLIRQTQPQDNIE